MDLHLVRPAQFLFAVCSSFPGADLNTYLKLIPKYVIFGCYYKFKFPILTTHL